MGTGRISLRRYQPQLSSTHVIRMWGERGNERIEGVVRYGRAVDTKGEDSRAGYSLPP